MTRLLLVFIDGGLLNAEGGLADRVITSLSSLATGGFEIIAISATSDTSTLFSESQLKQILDSQSIPVSKNVTFDSDVVDDTNSSVQIISGSMAPMLATGNFRLDDSAVVGDSNVARQLAEHLGMAFYEPVSWPDIASELLDKPRTAQVQRRSNETDIHVEVNLDPVTQHIAINTGIGFFDHMLEQIGKHSGMTLKLSCNGDLHIDEHHTVEDCALALGQALREALGDKRGIARYGFVLPMDECEVRISMDLSARPSFHFKGEFSRDKVGELSTEMVPHFFKSLSDSLGASLHITLEGENAHHQVEAIFKGAARVLGQAFTRQGQDLPSTKGML